MFNSSNPPILVFLLSPEQASNFPEKEGYIHHVIDDTQTALSYGTGWTFPVSAEQRKFITSKPLLLVRSRGGVTSEGSSFLKGYYNFFINDEGQTPECDVIKAAVFANEPKAEWMLVPEKVNIIWLQYGYKNQQIGSAGHEEQEFHYGKLMIRSMSVIEDYAPRFDRKADVPETHDTQFRVQDELIFETNWDISDESTLVTLKESIHEQGAGALDCYLEPVEYALNKAGYRG